MAGHRDDDFHPPSSDDPNFTETCWFTFAVPERKLSAQLYPFFRPNLGVTSGAAYVWNDTGSAPHTALYSKNFWHLPIPNQPLSDITLSNGLRYRCTKPLHTYEIGYTDPDCGDDEPRLVIDLTFEAIADPNYLGDSHLDQPGRYTGTIVLAGETIAVNSYGFRDRSWGIRPQASPGLSATPARRGGYSYATVGPDHGFHSITMAFDGNIDDAGHCPSIHGYIIREGTWSKVATGNRRVVERHATGAPQRIELELTDELGRTLEASGVAHNRIGVHLNPNLFTWNCLTEWSFDGVTAWGEDHDNWSSSAITAWSLRS